MCGRYVVKNPVTKTSKLVKSAIQVEDTENYNAHPYQKLPVIKKYKNGNTLAIEIVGKIGRCKQINQKHFHLSRYTYKDDDTFFNESKRIYIYVLELN